MAGVGLAWEWETPEATGWYDGLACLGLFSVVHVGYWVYTLSFLGVSLERYVTILRPLTYCYILTDFRISIVIGLTWALGLLFGVFPLLVYAVRDDSGCCCAFGSVRTYPPLLLTHVLHLLITLMVIGLYVHLRYIAARAMAEIRREQSYFRLRSISRNLRSANFAFAASVCHLGVLLLTNLFSLATTFSSSEGGVDVPMFLALNAIAYVDQILQPVVYAMFSPDFRRSARRLLAIGNEVIPDN